MPRLLRREEYRDTIIRRRGPFFLMVRTMERE